MAIFTSRDMPEKNAQVDQVHGFWNTEACGTHFVPTFSNEKEFYEKFREQRYRAEWHIPELVPFAAARGKEVLEIGTGNGADGVIFALNGAIYTGVDLTETALDATRRHFEVVGLRGTFRKENAEALSFPENSFDMVYSHGVLHHTPDTARAVSEVHRVLKPGGQAIVMLYHKRSFNYHVRIMLYMRSRVLQRILRRVGRWKADREKLCTPGLLGLRGNRDPQVWDVHYRHFLERGWRYLAAARFIHHCTDGPECPVAYAFSKAQARQLFAQFREVRMKVAHFPIRRYAGGQWVPLAVERFLARSLGWYLFIYGIK